MFIFSKLFFAFSLPLINLFAICLDFHMLSTCLYYFTVRVGYYELNCAAHRPSNLLTNLFVEVLTPSTSECVSI